MRAAAGPELGAGLALLLLALLLLALFVHVLLGLLDLAVELIHLLGGSARLLVRLVAGLEALGGRLLGSSVFPRFTH
ncbi:MAG: hypothetical protein ABR529_12940 [Actinomycetota bacterium]